MSTSTTPLPLTAGRWALDPFHSSVGFTVRHLGVSKVRVFRFLRTLLSLGYVLQDPETEKYRLSYKLYHLGQALAEQLLLVRR